MSGSVMLSTLWLEDIETGRLHKWGFKGVIRDASVAGKVVYSFDLVFHDGCDSYVIKKGFLERRRRRTVLVGRALRGERWLSYQSCLVRIWSAVPMVVMCVR
jgi:hypothetical protein